MVFRYELRNNKCIACFRENLLDLLDSIVQSK